MHEWLEAAAVRIATATGADPGDLSLDDEGVKALLDLARVAAHDSGDRTNAPLACYLVGIAIGRTPGARLDDVAAACAPAD